MDAEGRADAVLEVGAAVRNDWRRFATGGVTLWAKGHLIGEGFECVARHWAGEGAFEGVRWSPFLHGLDGHWALVAEGPGRALAAVDRVRSIPLIWAQEGESILVDQNGGWLADRLGLTSSDVDRMPR